MRSRVLLAVAAFASLAALATPGAANSETPRAAYVAGGTAVVKQAGQPAAADEGVLVCDALGSGVGGGCVGFGTSPDNSSVAVDDAVYGRDAVFQVCIDNDGDGACTSPDFGECADQVFFSHDDKGTNLNPLGPLPTGFAMKTRDVPCPGGTWRGYVVFLCNGTHAAGAAHAHPATRGVISTTWGGQGTGGTFCGGSERNPSAKRYVVTGL